MSNTEMEDVYSSTALENASRAQEGIYGYNNEYNPNRASDENLRNSLKELEEHNVHFTNPDPYKKQSNGLKTPEFVSHVGFDYIKDLDQYLKELEAEINAYKVKWRGTETQQGLNEKLEELNEKIEAKYANYRNGASRDADPEIEGLEEEYLELLELQENELVKVNEKIAKINELQEARKRWVQDCKERYKHSIKKRGEVQDQLEAAKKELKQLEAKQYMGEDSQFIRDRIEALKEIIENLEKEEREFHGNMGLGVVTVEFDPGLGRHPDFEYRPMNVGKGKRVTKPADPILDDEHELECWTLNGEPFNFETPVNENIKLVAKYRERTQEETPIINDGGIDKDETVKVTFNFNNGDESKTYTVKKGEAILSPGRPDKDGYKFDCWTLDGQPYNFASPVNNDITLDATFKKVHKVTIYGGKLGKKEAFENTLFEFEVLDGDIIDFESIENSLEYQANHEAQGKKNKINKGWQTLDGEQFEINTPINGDIEITANYKFDWVRVAGATGGVGLAAGIAAVDQQQFGGVGIANIATGAAALVGRAVRETEKFKLKNLEYQNIPTENLTGLKKASAKLKNYIHSEVHYKRLNTFLTSLGISSLTAGIAHAFIDEPTANTPINGNVATPDVPIDNVATPDVPIDNVATPDTTTVETELETVQEYFADKGMPDNIYDNALESSGGFNAENPLPEFEGAIPERAYNPNTQEWMDITKNTTMEEVVKTLGTENPQFDFIKDGQSVGWVDNINSYNGVSR